MSTRNIESVKKVAHGIRKRALEVTLRNNGCYLSQALSSAEIFASLYASLLKLGETVGSKTPPHLNDLPRESWLRPNGGRFNGPKSPEFDRLLISPAHYAVAVYCALVETGRMAPEGLVDFNADGGTVEMIGEEHSPGFELTTGSFGQCISQAGGIAQARKIRGESGRVFVFLSDGELQEGQTWEAMQAISFHKLDNVIVYVDVNGQQVDGYTKDVMNVEPLSSRFSSFGATAIMVDDHDIGALCDAPNHLEPGKPLVVLCYTDTARGISLLEKRKPKLHYVRFDANERKEFEALYQAM